MRGCPCGGLPGFCAPLGLLVAWVFWPSLTASDDEKKKNELTVVQI